MHPCYDDETYATSCAEILWCWWCCVCRQRQQWQLRQSVWSCFFLLYALVLSRARARLSVSYEIGGFTFFVKCSRTKKKTIAILFEIVVEYQLWIMVCIQNAPHFYTKCVISLSLVALVGNSGNSKTFYNFRFHAIEESSFIWGRSEWYTWIFTAADKNVPHHILLITTAKCGKMKITKKKFPRRTNETKNYLHLFNKRKKKWEKHQQ